MDIDNFLNYEDETNEYIDNLLYRYRISSDMIDDFALNHETEIDNIASTAVFSNINKYTLFSVLAFEDDDRDVVKQYYDTEPAFNDIMLYIASLKFNTSFMIRAFNCYGFFKQENCDIITNNQSHTHIPRRKTNSQRRRNEGVTRYPRNSNEANNAITYKPSPAKGTSIELQEIKTANISFLFQRHSYNGELNIYGGYSEINPVIRLDFKFDASPESEIKLKIPVLIQSDAKPYMIELKPIHSKIRQPDISRISSGIVELNYTNGFTINQDEIEAY
jgi:hypothetical protein